MNLLRVSMNTKKISFEPLPGDWAHLGGSALAAKIMNAEVPPQCDPLGPENKLIVACGPLAGTRAPQLGRISVGAKSPLTQGIKEANSGGPAGQFLDRLNIRAIIFEKAPDSKKLFLLYINKDGAKLLSADDYKGMKNYALAAALQKKYGDKVAIVSVGLAGERQYKGASVSLTDIFGDPSRNAARGGLGAVMGSKGLKAIVIDPAGAEQLKIARPDDFRKTVRDWADILKHDVAISLYTRFGTPFAINNSAGHGTLPAMNYRSGRPENFTEVSGHAIQKILFERGGKMHGCMPGCLVQCSIIYPDKDGQKICAAYEYETIALLGTNLGITNNDEIARLKFLCDDLGLDAIETGAALGVAAEAGKMKWGDAQGAARLLNEIEKETPLGFALANGVVTTARHLKTDRVPAFKGQALPAHDPRAVKGTGVTYFSSPMGADHTAGLTYRLPKEKKEQVETSLKTQIKAAACDAFGYCLNSVPGSASIYRFFADLMNARFDLNLSEDDVINTSKQLLRDQLAFNEKAQFSQIDKKIPKFFREELIAPTSAVFDVEEEKIKDLWKGLDDFKEKGKIHEIRIPPSPEILMGEGVSKIMDKKIKDLGVSKIFLVTDPFMFQSGRASEIQSQLIKSGLEVVTFSDVVPDPPIELVERAGKLYKEAGCNGILGLGGGSSLDTAKIIGLRVSHGGELREYESIIGGGSKIKPILPPVITIPTTSGTGSETNPCAVITDKARDLKFILMSNNLMPKLTVVDPLFTKTMPAFLTIESGIDALAHCIEGLVCTAEKYHPYYESKAVYGIKLIGRSLLKAYKNPDDIEARMDMCMASMCGGLALLKGLGSGHSISHALGTQHKLPHGRTVIYGLLAFVMANKETCRDAFSEAAYLLNRSNDLEEALRKLYTDLDIKISLKDYGISKKDLKQVAFHASREAVNLATDPASPSQAKILDLLTAMYE
ncbi:MAG TPA: iron-containing alcohol dehydrogenase [Smithellaceae bacterium]|nr:iron-containing alcohol dehydrogenase [Smithellaceae bacterium]